MKLIIIWITWKKKIHIKSKLCLFICPEKPSVCQTSPRSAASTTRWSTVTEPTRDREVSKSVSSSLCLLLGVVFSVSSFSMSSSRCLLLCVFFCVSSSTSLHVCRHMCVVVDCSTQLSSLWAYNTQLSHCLINLISTLHFIHVM